MCTTVRLQIRRVCFSSEVHLSSAIQAPHTLRLRVHWTKSSLTCHVTKRSLSQPVYRNNSLEMMLCFDQPGYIDHHHRGYVGWQLHLSGAPSSKVSVNSTGFTREHSKGLLSPIPGPTNLFPLEANTPWTPFFARSVSTHPLLQSAVHIWSACVRFKYYNQIATKNVSVSTTRTGFNYAGAHR